MSRSDLYFARGIVRGLGKVFFLKVPREAGEDTPARRLLGSYVDEIDYSLIKQAPALDHAWDPEFFLKLARGLEGWGERELVLTDSLSSFSQEYKIERKAGVEAKGSFPGAPISAGIEISYHRLSKATITMGPGSKKLYIPQNFIIEAYRAFAATSDERDRILFDDDLMLVNQIVIAKNMTLEVESETDFSAAFNAKAEQVNNLDAGIKYESHGSRKYKLSVSDGKEYLVAIGAVEADESV